MTATAAPPLNYLLLNGKKHPAVPIKVASQVIREWCNRNPNYSAWPGTKTLYSTRPYTVLAELSGVPARRMFDLYHGRDIQGRARAGTKQTNYKTRTISIEALDKIISGGMDSPELWHMPPLDLYYLPIDEWTDEMRSRHANL